MVWAFLLLEVWGCNDFKIYHYHTNHLGTPQELTNQDGDVVWASYEYAWGGTYQSDYQAQSLNHIPIDKDHLQPLRFQGQFFDPETSLHYNRFRYYDTDLGMFIQRDPIGLLGGSNVFQYAPNPIGWVDVLGLACKSLRKTKSNTKGNWGVARGANQMERQGFEVVGREIRMQVNGKSIRADLVGYNPSTGQFWVMETKVGKYAKLTKNQRASGVFSTSKSTLNQPLTLMKGIGTNEMVSNLNRMNVQGITNTSKINANFSMQHYHFPKGVFKKWLPK